jgi:hypothetical protein
MAEVGLRPNRDAGLERVAVPPSLAGRILFLAGHQTLRVWLMSGVAPRLGLISLLERG